ncbi:MAG: hypothetical protein JJT94_12820, partial [Bernardetiaceae bacterium]|nr:hypothetical protein [Bernardetiaceae bacterium]
EKASSVQKQEEKEASIEKKEPIDAKQAVMLLESNCYICHNAKPIAEGDIQIAPSMRSVSDVYIKAYPREANFVKAIQKYLDSPLEDHALMPDAIQKYGAKPPLFVSKEDSEMLLRYLYNQVAE